MCDVNVCMNRIVVTPGSGATGWHPGLGCYKEEERQGDQRAKRTKYDKNEELKCYNYKNLGHIKANCPLLMTKGNNKAFKVTTWDSTENECDEVQHEVDNYLSHGKR